MTPDDDRIRRLLVESLDAELGDRVDPGNRAEPGDRADGFAVTETGLVGAPRSRRTARWALPAAAAAVVAALVVTVVALVGPSHHPSGPAVGSSGTVVTCAPTGSGDVSKDRPAVQARATKIADGTPTVTVQDGSLVADVPGASRQDVSGLCSSSTVQFRPVIAPAVQSEGRAATDTHPLARLGFPAPTTEAAYDRLTTAQQRTIAHRLAGAECTPSSSASATPSAGTPIVACDNGETGARLAYLFGATIVDGTSVASAAALAPAANGTTTAQWSVTLTFDRHGAGLWSRFTGAHHTTATAASRTSATSCSSTTVPCEDFVGLVHNGRVASAAVNVAQLGATTQISGNYTRTTAKRLAAALREGQLPVPLEVTSVEAAR